MKTVYQLKEKLNEINQSLEKAFKFVGSNDDDKTKKAIVKIIIDALIIEQQATMKQLLRKFKI